MDKTKAFTLFLQIFAVISCIFVRRIQVQNTPYTCIYQKKNFSECAFMFWDEWKICNGVGCPLGKERRLKGVCCSIQANETMASVINVCKRNCNFTDSDFEELSMSNL